MMTRSKTITTEDDTMYMQLNEQFIVDERGGKQAVIIPFANYLKLLEILNKQEEPADTHNRTAIWQTTKGSAQAVKAWLASDTYQRYPVGNPANIEQTVQELRDAWGDESIMSNLTITVDEAVLKQARMRALEEGTSVNALLCNYLERYGSKGQHYRQVTDRILAIAERSTAVSQGCRWTRDELYDRFS